MYILISIKCEKILHKTQYRQYIILHPILGEKSVLK